MNCVMNDHLHQNGFLRLQDYIPSIESNRHCGTAVVDQVQPVERRIFRRKSFMEPAHSQQQTRGTVIDNRKLGEVKQEGRPLMQEVKTRNSLTQSELSG